MKQNNRNQENNGNKPNNCLLSEKKPEQFNISVIDKNKIVSLIDSFEQTKSSVKQSNFPFLFNELGNNYKNVSKELSLTEVVHVNKKYLIYTCVFHNEQYIELLKLFINGILKNCDKTRIDLLVITSEAMKTKIINKIPNINYNCIFLITKSIGYFGALSSKFDIYKYQNINDYSKIMYMDVDCVIIDDINKIFELPITDNKFYGVSNGTIDNPMYGYDIFQYDLINDCQKSCCSEYKQYKYNPIVQGIDTFCYLFVPSVENLNIFVKIRNKIYTYNLYHKQNIKLFDQPFFNYIAIINNILELTKLQQYCVNIDYNTYKMNKHIYCSILHISDLKQNRDISAKIQILKKIIADFDNTM
jgi:hypothetical protein